MEDPSHAIDAVLVPSMMELNVSEGLDRATSLVNESRESEALWKRVLERLEFLRNELKKPSSQADDSMHLVIATTFANMVGLFILLLKKFAQKKLLQRLATSRALREQVRELHAKIDDVFTLVGLSNTREMVAWKQHEAEDIAAQREYFNALVQSPSSLTSDLSGGSLEEALTELKLEIDSKQNPKDFAALLERALQTASGGKTITSAPSWYIRRDDVVIGEEFDVGSFGTVHKGKWGAAETEVMVKLLFMNGSSVQKRFLRDTDRWHRLSHDNIIKMYGGCHVGNPLFFVSEFASNGNFLDYFAKPENKTKLWRLFHQAAKGLHHLHSKDIVHSEIRCNNILVGNDGNAKLCDFGFAHIRKLSAYESFNQQSDVFRWKAPEYMFGADPDTTPTKMANVYSLGMSIIEAKTGRVPWGTMDNDDAMDNIAEEVEYPRPEGAFTDNEWELVQAMIDYDPEKRITLTDALAVLADLAKEEEGTWKKWDVDTVAEQILQCIREYIQLLPNLTRFMRHVMLNHFRREKLSLEQSQDERTTWEDAGPKTSLCTDCNNENPIDSYYCCDCGAVIDDVCSSDDIVGRYLSAFMDEECLLAAIPGLQKLASPPRAYHECLACGCMSPVENNFCGDCGNRLNTEEQKPFNLVLSREINRLEHLQAQQKKEARSQVKERVCSRCGEMNDAENVFCCECGTDIEVIARHVL